VVNGGAAHVVAEVVVLGAASITEVVVGWVNWAGWGRWSRAGAASGNTDVANGQGWPVAGAGAAVVPQPGGVTAPV